MKSISDFLKEHEEERQPALVWSRCMGYYRNTIAFNIGKQSEFKQRVFFKMKKGK